MRRTMYLLSVAHLSRSRVGVAYRIEEHIAMRNVIKLIRIDWIVDCCGPIGHYNLNKRLLDDFWEDAAVLWLHCPIPEGQPY